MRSGRSTDAVDANASCHRQPALKTIMTRVLDEAELVPARWDKVDDARDDRRRRPHDVTAPEEQKLHGRVRRLAKVLLVLDGPRRWRRGQAPNPTDDGNEEY